MNMDKIYEILENLHPEYDFKESDDFIEDGYLDSFDIVSLISAIEEHYTVTIDGLDIVPESFSSAKNIAALIGKSGGAVE